MKNMGIVRGSEEQAKELIVGFDTVYVHKNIKKLENGDYEYKEIQYDKNEYIALMANENANIKAEMEKKDLENKIALGELYDMITEGGVVK